MVGCWLPGLTYGVNLTGVVPRLLAGSVPATFAITPEGPAQSFTAQNTELKTANLAGSGQVFPPNSSTQALTVYYRGYAIGTPQALGVFIGGTANNTNTSPFWQFYMRANNVATLYQVGWFNSAGATNNLSTGGLVSSGLISACTTYVPGGNINLYVNGALDANFPIAFGGTGIWGATGNSSTSYFEIGSDDQNASRSCNSNCNMACVWNRALSAQEVKVLHLNPYSFLIPNDVLGLMPAPPPPPAPLTASGFTWQEW